MVTIEVPPNASGMMGGTDGVPLGGAVRMLLFSVHKGTLLHICEDPAAWQAAKMPCRWAVPRSQDCMDASALFKMSCLMSVPSPWAGTMDSSKSVPLRWCCECLPALVAVFACQQPPVCYHCQTLLHCGSSLIERGTAAAICSLSSPQPTRSWAVDGSTPAAPVAQRVLMRTSACRSCFAASRISEKVRIQVADDQSVLLWRSKCGRCSSTWRSCSTAGRGSRRSGR